jgi:hypothetical protein
MPDNVKMMELDGVKTQVGDVTDRGTDIVRRFAGEAEDEMSTKVEVTQPGPTDGIVKGSHTMAAIDEGKSLIMTGFKAEFQPKIGA